MSKLTIFGGQLRVNVLADDVQISDENGQVIATTTLAEAISNFEDAYTLARARAVEDEDE